MIRHFTHLHEIHPDILMNLVEQAIKLKQYPPRDRPLAGKAVTLCFLNPSLRTRASMEIAAGTLGAVPLILEPGKNSWALEYALGKVMDGPAAEHASEAVRVLSRYGEVLGLRAFPSGKTWEEDCMEPELNAFRQWSEVPVINLESATGHPCQALADLMTIHEHMEFRNKTFLLTWAPHIKGLPLAVPHSAAEIAAYAGMNVTIARPKGFDLAPEVMVRVQAACQQHGTKLTVTDNPDQAYTGAHVVYAKSWMSLKAYGAAPPQDAEFRRRWLVDARKMALTDKALFMHCLPVRRNLVVADEVIDGPWSVVIDEAENRLHTARAILLWLLNDGQL